MIQFFLILARFASTLASVIKKDPQFRALVILVLAMLLTGTFFYSNVEGWSLLDSLYFSVTTLTTVGYGDLSPQTTLGKIFTMIYILSGLGIIAGFATTLGKELLEGRQRPDAQDKDGPS